MPTRTVRTPVRLPRPALSGGWPSQLYDDSRRRARQLTPLFLGYVRGYSAWQTGTAIFSTGAASLVGVPIYIVLAKRFDTRRLMVGGLAMFGAAMWSYSAIT